MQANRRAAGGGAAAGSPEDQARLLEQLEAVKREEAGRAHAPEGRPVRRRIGSRTTKCHAGAGGSGEGGQAVSPTAACTPKLLAQHGSAATAAVGSKTRKEKISAVLENRIRDGLRLLFHDPRRQWRRIQESCRSRKMGQAFVTVEELCETVAQLTSGSKSTAGVSPEDLVMVFKGQVPDEVFWEDYVEWYCRR